MAQLQLWRVKVTHVREVSGEAMVQAESQRGALQMAEAEVDLDDVFDADVDYTSSRARRVDVAELDAIKPGHEWLVMPDGKFRCTVSDQLRAARRAKPTPQQQALDACANALAAGRLSPDEAAAIRVALEQNS